MGWCPGGVNTEGVEALGKDLLDSAMGGEEEFLGQGIVLYGSNDPDELVAQCARDLATGLSDHFKEEEFLVQDTLHLERKSNSFRFFSARLCFFVWKNRIYKQSKSSIKTKCG